MTPKHIIEALSYYSDPAMSFVDEVLPSKVDSFTIPYNLNNYAKYIDAVAKCEFSYKGYSTDFIEAIEKITGVMNGGTVTAQKPSRKLFG